MIDVGVPGGFGDDEFAYAKAAIIIWIVFGVENREVFYGFGKVIGIDASAFFEVTKTRDTWAVDFYGEHAATAHEVGENYAYSARAKFDQGFVGVAIVCTQAADIAGHAFYLATAKITQGVNGMNGIRREGIDGSL